MKNRIISTALAVTMGFSLAACNSAAAGSSTTAPAETAAASQNTAAEAGEEKRLSIVTTNFPEYDFARQIAGDLADVTLLLKPGSESHSYEPTPADIITIQNSDLFVYLGGDSDEWVADVLTSMDQSSMSIFKLMDCVELYEEELVEGMEEDHHHHGDEEHDHDHDAAETGKDAHEEHDHDHDSTAKESHEEHDHEHDAASGETHDEHDHDHEHEHEEHEMDEHVWTAPANAMTIVAKMAEEMEKLDPANKDAFAKNAESYIAQIDAVDKKLQDVISTAKRREIIVGDRFPFRYFCEEFGLTYYAAFPGCSTDTQASAKTVAFLIDKVKADKIPVVFHIELSNEQMADSIAEATGAKKLLLNAIHNVSDEEFKNGATYVSLMEHNVEVLKEALN